MISFVVPAFNEADSIEACVASIHEFAPRDEEHEIVVVDNGSTDDTAALAEGVGARVIASDAKTISGVRNDGVAHTTGDVLVLLDADCALTEDWARELPRILEQVRSTERCCAGSQVTPPLGEDVFLWKHWFVPFFQKASTLGSAHMICLRETFDAVGGFDEALATGEDYEFCVQVIAAGGYIVDDPALRVEHHGFPRTWRHFMRRERWHGRGDTTSLRAYLGSKVAIASTLFAALVLAAPVAVVLGATTVGLVAASAALVMLVGASALRFRHARVSTRLAGVWIFAMYFAARAVSVADGLVRWIGRR